MAAADVTSAAATLTPTSATKLMSSPDEIAMRPIIITELLKAKEEKVKSAMQKMKTTAIDLAEAFYVRVVEIRQLDPDVTYEKTIEKITIDHQKFMEMFPVIAKYFIEQGFPTRKRPAFDRHVFAEFYDYYSTKIDSLKEGIEAKQEQVVYIYKLYRKENPRHSIDAARGYMQRIKDQIAKDDKEYEGRKKKEEKNVVDEEARVREKNKMDLVELAKTIRLSSGLHV